MIINHDKAILFYNKIHNIDDFCKDIHAWDKYKMPYYGCVQDNGYKKDTWELRGISSPDLWEIELNDMKIENGFIILDIFKYLITPEIQKILDLII